MICAVLPPGSTVVIETPDLGTGLNYSISAIDVPINIEQSQRFPCTIFSGNCSVLVAFTSSTDFFQASFQVFLGDNLTIVKIGELETLSLLFFFFYEGQNKQTQFDTFSINLVL